MAGPEAARLSGEITLDLSSDAHIKAALAIQVSFCRVMFGQGDRF